MRQEVVSRSMLRHLRHAKVGDKLTIIMLMGIAVTYDGNSSQFVQLKDGDTVALNNIPADLCERFQFAGVERAYYQMTEESLENTRPPRYLSFPDHLKLKPVLLE